MVQGIKFLTKKSFNPTNITNQKVVWEREQQQQHRLQQIQERNKVLQQEKDNEQIQLSRGGSTKVNFLYEPPPGLTTTSTTSSTTGTSSTPVFATTATASTGMLSIERQPGDDDAAAAFRQLLHTATNTGNDTAYHVAVHDVISSNLDLNTFEILGASHTMNAEILPDRKVVFHFNYIMLPDSTTNKEKAHPQQTV